MSHRAAAVVLIWNCLAIASALATAGEGGHAPAGSAAARAAPSGELVVSSRLLNHFLQRDVERRETVAEPVLNMFTTGNADARCRVSVQLVPNAQTAVLRLTMTGQATMDDAVASSRSVRVYSSSRTDIRASKDVFLHAEGLRVDAARATGVTDIYIHGVEAPLRIVERLAWRRAGRMEPLAEAAAAESAARRAERQMNAEVDGPLAEMQQRYLRDIQRPLAERHALPIIATSTTGEELRIQLLSNRPKSTQVRRALHGDLAMHLHGSLVEELAGAVLAGKTVTDRQFLEMMHTLTGQMPRPLWVHARAEPWQVTLAKTRPLAVAFDDDRLTITLRLDAAECIRERLGRPLEITASFRPEATIDGPRLVRLGDLRLVVGGDDEPLRPKEEAMLAFLRQKFGGVFPPELYFDGLVPPDGGSWGRLRALVLKEFSSHRGWLSVGYELVSNRSNGYPHYQAKSTPVMAP